MTPSGLGPHPVCFPALSDKLRAWYDRVTGGLTRQYPPWMVQLEAVEGCRMRCGSCGIASIRHPTDSGGSVSDLREMTPELAGAVAAQMRLLDWADTRIEISGHGEPTMHSDLPGLVRAVRKQHRRVPISIISGGQGLLGRPGPYQRLVDLYDAGVQYIGVTVHDVRMVDRIREVIGLLARHGVEARSHPEEYNASIMRRIREPGRVIAFLDPPRTDLMAHLRTRNLAGAASARTADEREQPCARPFRELAVRWDGHVALCQDDWRGEYKCGHVGLDGLGQIWDGDEMTAARRHLMMGRHDIQLCRGCSSRSNRPHHLPDPHHAMTIAPPDDSTRAVVESAQAGEPYTAPVRRPWERGL